MKCKLCKNKYPNKKNTHFLTDSVIRTCLNENGENIREKGFYFDISNDSAFIEFNFQRRTSIEKLTTTLGRIPNEEDIAKAKQIPFSVDNIFCSDCENKFTEIEEKFIKKYLESFRTNQFSNKITFNDFKTIKSFFLLQIWRTSICDEIFEISTESAEKLRLIILNNNDINEDKFIEFPLSVTYLTTENINGASTENFVGYTDDKNPNLILMNDFIIQFFNNQASIKYFDFYGLNDLNDYRSYLNTNSDGFTFKILNDEQRIQLLTNLIENDKVKPLMKFYTENFVKLWHQVFGNLPTSLLIHQYLMYLTDGDNKNLLQYTKETICEMTSKFIEDKLR